MSVRAFVRAIRLLAIALALAHASAHAQTTAAGFTPGAFRVSESGAATYSIPIQAPPGIAGLEPKLSLTYSSQAGNGLLGVGWALSGLSLIHRCAKTPVQDGVKGGLNYDTADRSCLDGQRLVAISGDYGANGTVYRTERESYSRIVSYGAAGNGPSFWKIWTKSGQIIEYGNTTDSRVEALGKSPTVRVWAVNKIGDTAGNYLEVAYTELSNGDFYPFQVSWTGNAGASVSPVHSVQFVYETRPDPILTDIAGSAIRNYVRISKLQTYAGSTVTKEYRLAYEQGATGRSRLTAVTECTGDGAYCFAPTTFTWQNPTLGSQNFDWSGGHGNAGGGWQMANPFGDGRQIYYTFSGSGGHYATWLKLDGTIQNFSWSGGHGLANDGWQMADLFGEGRQVYHTHSTGGDHYATKLNADSSLQNYSWSGGHGVGGAGWAMGDLFGDGRQLYFTHSGSGSHYATLLKPDSTLQNFSWTGGHGLAAAGWQLVDLFGDGRQLYYTHDGSGNHYATRLNPDGTLQNFSWSGGHGVQSGGWKLADLFGDGRQVYYTRTDAGCHYATRLNSDQTLQNFTWCGGHGAGTVGWDMANVFGDGRQVYVANSTDGCHYATRLNADETFQNFTWCSGHGLAGGGWQMADVFGSGRQGYYTRGASDGAHYFTSFASLAPDLVTAVTTGLTAVVSIAYKPLTDAAAYTKDTGATYPYVDLQAPLYVASSVTSSNGIGGTVAATYAYAGARAHLQGGGFLGFREIRSTDEATGNKTTSTFRVVYPFRGLPLVAERKQSSGAVITRVTNSWNDNPSVNSIGYSFDSGVYHRSDLTTAIEETYELSSVPVTTVTTNTTYDAYGNAATINVSTGDGYSKATTNTFTNDAGTWFLGRLTRSQVVSTTP